MAKKKLRTRHINPDKIKRSLSDYKNKNSNGFTKIEFYTLNNIFNYIEENPEEKLNATVAQYDLLRKKLNLYSNIMTYTKLMSRIFSAQDSGETEVLRQFETDIEIAKEDGILDTEEYSIVSDEDGIDIYDKVNDEFTKVEESEEEIQLSPKEVSDSDSANKVSKFSYGGPGGYGGDEWNDRIKQERDENLDDWKIINTESGRTYRRGSRSEMESIMNSLKDNKDSKGGPKYVLSPSGSFSNNLKKFSDKVQKYFLM